MFVNGKMWNSISLDEKDISKKYSNNLKFLIIFFILEKKEHLSEIHVRYLTYNVEYIK